MLPPYTKLTHSFLTIRTEIKLYHWQTRSYARHKATDRFLETFEPLVDRFVEAAQGIVGDTRVSNLHHPKNSLGKLNDTTAHKFLSKFRKYIAGLTLPYSELAQIRDDMLEICDITLYLFTLH